MWTVWVWGPPVLPSTPASLQGRKRENKVVTSVNFSLELFFMQVFGVQDSPAVRAVRTQAGGGLASRQLKYHARHLADVSRHPWSGNEYGSRLSPFQRCGFLHQLGFWPSTSWKELTVQAVKVCTGRQTSLCPMFSCRLYDCFRAIKQTFLSESCHDFSVSTQTRPSLLKPG